MKNTWVVVTDLGGFKAYRINNGQPNRTPQLELVEEYRNAGAHDHLVDNVTVLGRNNLLDGFFRKRAVTDFPS